MNELKIRSHRDVVLRSVASEKSYGLLDKDKYTFIVALHANEIEIKIAIEKTFDVHAIAISTQSRQGKHRRTRFGIGKRVDVECAIATIVEGDYIDISAGQDE